MPGPKLPRNQVLITRPAAEAAATAAQVRARGFLPVLAPLLEVLGIALRPPGQFDAVLLTSGNAIAALTGISSPILAVGDATAQRALAAGFTDVKSASGDAADLVALVQRRFAPGASLLLATGRGQGDAVTTALRAAGFRVHRRVVYHARPATRLPGPASAALLGGQVRAALFLSAETARTFVRLLPPELHPTLEGIEALTIGQPAADALTPLPWARVRVSVLPTLDQVLALL